MSAQSAKKKRIGSRRRVANQNKTTDADEFHIMDSVSVAEPYTPEENIEPLNVLANPDHLQSETPNPPSPELSTNRRKLGSSRRNKGGQRVKDSATESHHRPSEEIEEKTRDDETPQTTRMSLAMQPQRQEVLSQGREHYVTHDSSLYSAITPDYSSEVQYTTTDYPETDQESFVPKSENLQADQDENDENKIVSNSGKLGETVFVGTTKSDTLQSEELKENADLVGTSELTSVLSCPTVDQQLIDQSESRKIPEEIVFVYSVTEEESKERDKDTELSKQNGNLQGSESHAKSVVAQFSATPEITTDKSSPRENTKLEYIVEEATFLTPNKELPKDEEQNEHFSISEVSSEDAVNKMHGQEVNQTEMHEIDHTSESVTHDAAEKSEMISGKLIDEADTCQSESTVKSNDDSTTKQEDSNPDDGHDGHPTEENNLGAEEHKNEDYHVYDTKKLQSSGRESSDTALSHVYEDDGQEGDDRKSNAKQTVHLEKQGLSSEMEESDASLQPVQSEANASLDYQPLQNDTGFNTFGNRRKLESSRRNKGRQHFKEPAGGSYHEHKEEALETTEMSVAIEGSSQEELSQGSEHDVIMTATQDSSLYSNIMPNHSSTVQNPTTSNYPEDYLESLIPTSENLQEDRDDHDFKMEVSDKSVGVTSEGMDDSGTRQEVLGAHLSEDAVNKVHEQEVKPTQDTDHPSESVTNDATENSEIISQNLTEQAEVRDTYQSVLVVKSTDDSATRQEVSNPDDKQDEHPSKENNLEALEHKNDYHVADIKSSAEQTHHEEREATFSEMESESSLQTLQSEANAPLDSEPLDNSVRIEEQNDTGFHPIGNRRKLGSSRRNKGRQQVKESVAASHHEHKKEVLERTRYNEALEGTQMLVTIERTSQEELSQESEHGDIMSATHGNSSYSNIIADSFEILNPTIPAYPETDLEHLIHTSDNLQEECDQTEIDFKVEVPDESVEVERTDESETLQSQEVRGAHHSEDAVKQPHEQDQPTQMHGIVFSSQSTLHDADDTDDSATKHKDLNPFDKQDEHPTEENSFEVLEQTNEDYQVHDTKKLQIGGIITADTALGQVHEIEGREEQTVHQENEGLSESHSKSEDIESSITSEISTEKHSLSEHTQAECSVEQEIFSSTKEELPTNEEQNEHFNLAEAKDAQYSEDAMNKVCEQEVKTTQVHIISHSSENVTHEATETHEIIPGNLIGEGDDTDTYQSGLILKSTDDSATEQEDKQNEHPTKENSEASEHTNEDYHVYDTKKQQTRGIENADIALSQAYEIQGQVEDDVKPNAEQTVHQERQGLFSEIEQGGSSLQSMQSESNTPLDSKPQQDDTKFSPIGNRRKLGSRRRNKGRPHAKESVAESSPTEEVSGNTKEIKPLETIKMSLTMDTAVQENSMETTLEGIETCDTSQTEEVNYQVKENPHVGTLGGISEHATSNLHSSVTVNQQLIDQSDSTGVPDEELSNASTVTAKESNARDENTELLSKDGNLEDSCLVSESYLKTEDIESPVMLKITTERQSPREHTQPECSLEQAISSSPTEELPTSEEQNEHFNLPEVKGAQHSEDAVNKVHEQEVNPTQKHEMEHFSESVTHDVTENPEIISANMINQAEDSDTYQSELVVKSTDDSATKQEDSNPDAKQDDDLTKEDNFKALEQTDVDYHVSDTKKQQTSGIENEDTALGQVHEIEGRVEDDMRPSAERTGHQEKEGIFSEMEESESSLQTQQADINAPLDFQPQVDSVGTEEQTHTGFNPIGNRRKLGSSRRNKGRQQVKESVAESSHEHKDVLESARGNETLETTHMLMTTEKTNQEELSQEHEHDITTPVTHDSSLYSTILPDSSEVQNPEAVLEGLNLTSEKLKEDHEERETDFKVDVSDQSVAAELEGMNKPNTPQSQEVRGVQHSEDTVNKVHEQEVNPTQKHEMEHFSESVTHDVTENPEIISVNLINQAEDSDTYQSELVVKSTDDFATKQEDSNPDAKQDDDLTKEDNVKALEQTDEDFHVTDTNKQETSGTEHEDTTLGQVYEIESQVEGDIKPGTEQTVPQEKQGLFSDMEEGDFPLQTLQLEINAPLDSQPLQNNTNFNPTGNRRKFGSSRRNKGRQHAKDSTESCHRPTEEVVGNTRDNELEITKMSLTIETAGIETCDTAQTEEVSDHVKENAHVGTLDGISELTTRLCSGLTVDHQITDHSNSTEMPEQELPNVYSVTVKESNERDKDTELLGKDENLQDDNLDIESSMTPEITTEKSSPADRTDMECSGEQAALTSLKEELSSNEEQKEHVNLSQIRGSLHAEDVLNEVYEEAVKTTQTEEIRQIDELTYEEEGESSLQILESEMNAPSDSQPLDTSVSEEEKIRPGFNPAGVRRKLGSSRRNKGRQHVKDSVTETYHNPEEEFVRGDGVLETTNMSLATETMKQEELKMQTDQDLKPTRKTRKKRSVNDEDREKVPENDGNTIVTTDITSSPEKDDSIKSNTDIDEEESNLIEEPENIRHFTGHDTVKTDLIQSPQDDSDVQTISHHDDKATTKPAISKLLEQEDANKVQNTDTLSCDKDSRQQEIIMQQTNNAVETVGDVMIKDCNTGAECAMDVQVFGQDEAGEKDLMDASLEITHAELFSAAHNKTDTLASSDIHFEENARAEPAVEVLEESGISTAVMQETTNLDDSENSLGKSKQKRRKMGSSRRIQLKRILEEGMVNEDEMKKSDFNMEAGVKNIGKMEAEGELPMTVTAEVSQNENLKSSDLQSIQSQPTSDTGDLTALLPGQAASHNEDVVDRVEFVQVTDTRDREKNVDINIEPSQVDITHVQNDEDRPESANVIQDQALKSAEISVVAVADLEIVKSLARGGAAEEQKDAQATVQEPNNTNEEAHSKNLEMKNASPNLNSPNRRRKMGSSRRSVGSRRKEEDLHQKPQVDNEATEAATKVEDVKTESFPSIKEKEKPQLHIEDKDGDSEQRKEKVFETVEYSHTGESDFKPPSHQAFEESPASQGQPVEMEPQLTPNYVPTILSTSPKHDASEAAAGRRRKMGSHRKSRVHQDDKNQTTREGRITVTQNVRDVRSVPEESAIKTTEEESLGLNKRSEADEGDKKQSSNISTSNVGEPPKPVSEKTPKQVTPVQQPYAEIHLGQESQKTLSLAGGSGGTPLRSKSFNVMMIGDSSVGKTSFMKRAQSGKFSLDLPASVGLDSCKWTVVVDGKPVVLQLWDTAGQERFHSITRQIFHKAQAFLLMYDITSSQSFAAVSYWANCIQDGAAENVTILLIGNKSDCAERQVKTQEGESLAKEYNYEFMECSAATGENVIQSLETVARMLSQKVDTREETMVLQKEPQQKKSSGCC